MKKALLIASVLMVAVISTACINNIAIQELNNKAAEYMEKGDYEAAVSRLESSVELDSTIYETHYNLGVAAINAKQYEKAISALENGIKLKPDYPEFYYSLGVAQSELSDTIEDGTANKDAESQETSDENTEFVPSEEDKAKIMELRKSSVSNLQKYLVMSPESTEKASIEELIEALNKYISENEVKTED